jgi:flagellar biosynthesis GTPase FlhF
MLSKRRPETAEHKVTGRNLREALDNARRLYGEQACVVDTRNVTRRDENGLGRTQLIEVSLTAPAQVAESPTPATPRAEVRVDYARAIAAEVERIEDLVETLRVDDRRRPSVDKAVVEAYPLGRELLAAGASLPAVRHLQRLYRAEVGDDGTQRAAHDHLQGLVRTSGGTWSDVTGCHLFLGGPGAGKTDLVLSLAARLKDQRRRVLVLSFAPRHGGEVRRLQEEAAVRGYDAAILRDAAQLAGGLDYFAQYDAVLIDTPALESDAMTDEATVRLLAGHEDIHRHLVLPVDVDMADRERSWSVARAWNCDWLALSRLDQSTRAGKLVDILLAAPFPLSLIAGGAWPGPGVELATPVSLLGRVLEEVPGGEAAPAAAAASGGWVLEG